MRFRSVVLVSALAFTAAACSENGEPIGPSEGGDAQAFERRAEGEGGPIRLFQVTIENLTRGQPLSPGVVVVHRPTARLFAAGTYASPGIQAIAEDGDPSVAASDLPGVPGVYDVVATTAPVFQVGGPGPNVLSVTINAEPNGNRLSLALMLICSNDGFVGLNSVKLPANRRPLVYYARAYDSGTEENDEASTSIVDPCFAIGPVAGAADGNARTASNGRVRRHAGIRGVGDLTRAHAWDGPIAKVTIERIG